MGRTITTSGLPPRWGIQQDSAANGRRVLWFGPHRIAISDIQSVNSEEARERPIDGLLLGAIVFLAVSCILAFAVYENEWRERFLLGTVFLGFLGTIGVTEVRKIAPQSFFQIKIATASQGTIIFASANRAEVDALLAGLASAGVAA